MPAKVRTSSDADVKQAQIAWSRLSMTTTALRSRSTPLPVSTAMTTCVASCGFRHTSTRAAPAVIMSTGWVTFGEAGTHLEALAANM